jgi:hypothetical protein
MKILNADYEKMVSHHPQVSEVTKPFLFVVNALDKNKLECLARSSHQVYYFWDETLIIGH